MPAPILTVTLNPAVDRTYTVPGFAVSHIHPAAQVRVTAGGKGVNVARVYQTLGGRAITTGFLGGGNGNFIRRQLAAEGIADAFVPVVDESRVCTKVMDPNAGTQTEVNESGPTIGAADIEALLARLRELLPGCGAVVLSGSLPPGAPVTLYRDCIRLAQEEFGVRAVLDASGEALAEGVTARPFLVKPNIHELAALAIAAVDCGAAAALLRTRFGVEVALVTAGAQGAALACETGVWGATPPRVRVLSAVGSGDALTGGFVWALERGESLPECLRLAVGAGAANVLSDRPGFLESTQVFNLASRTRLTRFV